MTPILALWAVPRSTSTAFEWMMRQRGDFECVHEPFGEAWYFGTDRRTPRPKRYLAQARPELRICLVRTARGCRPRSGLHEGLPALCRTYRR